MTLNLTEDKLEIISGGGVSSAAGFSASGIRAGLKPGSDKLDLALVVAAEPCPATGVFTQNAFSAAPVQICKKNLVLSEGSAKAILINTVSANAGTGQAGFKAANSCVEALANKLSCEQEKILIASTGVIGLELPAEKIVDALDSSIGALGKEGGENASKAIMTTDTCNKQFALRYISKAKHTAGKPVTIGAMAKGVGMIMPNMATMISVITTDAKINPDVLNNALSEAVGVSFNKTTVDGDTSTNDSCFMMASGMSTAEIKAHSDSYDEFVFALKYVCTVLAKKMASDGEGATKLVVVKVVGAASDEEADLAARTIANSPLVKTAINGRDANWGRVLAAVGRSGAKLDKDKLSISFLGMMVFENGSPNVVDEDLALQLFDQDEIEIVVDLCVGDCSTEIYTCDFSKEYISINGDYRS